MIFENKNGNVISYILCPSGIHFHFIHSYSEVSFFLLRCIHSEANRKDDEFEHEVVLIKEYCKDPIVKIYTIQHLNRQAITIYKNPFVKLNTKGEMKTPKVSP